MKIIDEYTFNNANRKNSQYQTYIYDASFQEIKRVLMKPGASLLSLEDVANQASKDKLKIPTVNEWLYTGITTNGSCIYIPAKILGKEMIILSKTPLFLDGNNNTKDKDMYQNVSQYSQGQADHARKQAKRGNEDYICLERNQFKDFNILFHRKKCLKEIPLTKLKDTQLGRWLFGNYCDEFSQRLIKHIKNRCDVEKKNLRVVLEPEGVIETSETALISPIYIGITKMPCIFLTGNVNSNRYWHVKQIK